MAQKTLAMSAPSNGEEYQYIFAGVRELTEQETLDLEIALRHINTLKDLRDSKYNLENNYNQFINLMNNKEQFHFGSMNVKSLIGQNYLLLESNRCLSNLLASMVATVEHYFKSKLDATYKDKYKNKISELYDSGPEYPFLYQLRNFIQHQKIPISNINMSDELNKGKTVYIYLNKNILLSYDSWKPIVKDFFQRLPERFEITNIVIEVITKLFEIFLSIEKEFENEYIKYFDTVTNYIKEIMDYGAKKGHNAVYPCLIDEAEIKNDETGLEIRHYDFPLILLSELGLVKFNFE